MPGTAGRPSSRLCELCRSGPRPLQKRSVVTVTPGLRSAKPRTASSASTMSRSSRVRGGCGRRMSSVKKLWVVALAAVVVGARLEDDLLHRRVRAAARGQDVHRPDDVLLVRDPGRGGRRVHDEASVDHGVDLGGVHDPAQQRVMRAHADELGALERAVRVVRGDADDHLHRRVGLQLLREPATPVAGQAGDQDAAHPSHTDLRSASIAYSSSWIRARTSSATVCTRPLSFHGSSPHWSVGIGSRKRMKNFAGK